MHKLALLALLATGAVLLAPAANAQTRQGARINNLKVLSDKIDDVTTPENILKSFVKPGMTDAERAKAIWTAAVRYRHQCAPPNEELAGDWEAHDPVKIFNVYGYCMCCCTSSLMEALNRLDGREARGRILNGHSVPEVEYGGGWHMYDCSLINYFPKPDGDAASVDEISQAVRDWYAANPGYKGNGAKLFELMKSDGWMGWKEKGPALLANNPFYKFGYWGARTHGWDATMSEYNLQSPVYEYGYQIGHRALFSMRPGESLERDAGNRGLHVNMDKDPNFDQLKAKVPANDLVYVNDYLKGYNGGVVGNGYQRYAPDFAAGNLAQGAEVYDNLAEGAGAPALHPKVAGKPGVAVVEMSTPYVYLGGRIRLGAYRKSDADRVAISISTNGGRDYQPLWTDDKTGASDATIELKERVLRRYAYLLKIEITASAPRSAGLNALSIENDIQHAPRTLPWLGKGANTITVASDMDARIASKAITGRITPDPKFTKNETAAGVGVQFDNLDFRYDACWWKGGAGTMTVPIDTPGDLVGLRFGAQVRARGDKDRIKMALSYDGGKTWSDAAEIAGPTAGTTRYFKTSAVPAGVRKALLRYTLTGNNTVGIFSFRVDADYRDPLAAAVVRPFTVTHKWRENGQEKSAKTTVTRLPFTYQIHTDADPEVVSVTYAMDAK
jgi:hypothetical protein